LVLRQFGAGLLALAAVGAFTQREHPAACAALLGVGLGVTLVTALAPRALRPLFVGVSALTFPLGLLLQRLLLAAFFFGCFTPLALVLRGYRRLRGRHTGSAGWVTVNDPRQPDDYFRPY
jgi:hypothetical protein